MRPILLFIFIALSCKQHGLDWKSFSLPLTDTITHPSFHFEYGSQVQIGSFSNDFFKEQTSGICLYSLPESLYFQETGAKFKICLPVNTQELEDISQGFRALDEETSTKTVFHAKSLTWEATETTLGKWQKEKEGIVPDESFVDLKTLDGTIAYARFDVPSASVYEWEANHCEVLFPSRRISGSKNAWKLLSVRFTCPHLEIKEKIEAQNEIWLRECVESAPSLTESFRHSESPFGRFLEWSNESDQIYCPRYQHLSFEEGNAENLLSLESESIRQIEERHRILLPHSAFLLSTSEQLSGVKVNEELLLQIGKAGNWHFANTVFPQTKFNFKQGDEFFSQSISDKSCRNQFQYQFANIASCLNPGIPNDLLSTNVFTIASCKPSQLEITEYFAGAISPLSIPAYVEIQNREELCDLSNIQLTYAEDTFHLSAKERLLGKYEYLLVSKDLWNGWPFLSINRTFTSRDFKNQIPVLTLRSREGKGVKNFPQSNNDVILTNRDGLNERSIVFDTGGFLYPHPNENGNQLFSQTGIYISPGESFAVDHIPFLNLSLSELLINGTKDAIASYPERFIEWQDTNYQSGYVYFQIESQSVFRYLYYKDGSESFPFVKNGTGLCLPNQGILLPDGSLPNAEMKISNLNKNGQPETNSFRYHKSLYESFGVSTSARISLHPESHPFGYSLSRSHSFSQPCSPHSEATPGRANQKVNQFATNVFLNAQGIPYVKSFSFLSTPDTNSLFRFKSLTKVQLILSMVLQNVLDLTSENLSSSFFDSELIYLEWEDFEDSLHLSQIFRLGEVRIESVYPSPSNPQNEWVYFCNITSHQVSVVGYVIEDESSTDKIVPYAVRFPSQMPNFKSETTLRYTDSLLNQGDCAFIVDPDGNNWYLPPFAKNTDLLLTVGSSQTIGNGISNLERLDLYQENSESKILLSSYGNKTSLSPFQIPLANLEYSLLKKDSLGNKPSEFQIFRELP